MKPSSKHESDLQWLAYCYVTGDLPADEFEMFELRMLDDQAAREAVADAVQLHDALLAVGHEAATVEAPAPLAVWNRVIAIVAMVAAVTLFVLMAQPETGAPNAPVISATQPSLSGTPIRQLEPAADQNLAELWATEWETNALETTSRIVAVNDDWSSDGEPQEEIAWDQGFDSEATANWMWEALDVTVTSEGDMEMPEEESL